MRHTTPTIASKLHRAQHLIGSTRANAEIKDIVARRGYPESALELGQIKYDAAARAVDAQAVAAGAARLATQYSAQAEREARAMYQELVQTVRALFPATAAERKSLEINGQMPQDTSAFLAAAMTLFNNALALPAIRATLEQYGYDEIALLRGREAIVAYQQALQAQVSAKSAAIQATAAQKAALEELQTWTAQYVKIARITLRKRVDLLRVLGLAPQRKASPAKQRDQPENVPTDAAPETPAAKG
jgi:hypothetical protein